MGRKGTISIRRRQAHLVHDGLVAWVRVQKIQTRLALQKRQVRRPLTITLFQVMDGLFFVSELRICIHEIGGGNILFRGPLLQHLHVPLKDRSEASSAVDLNLLGQMVLLSRQFQGSLRFFFRLFLHPLKKVCLGENLVEEDVIWPTLA